MRRSRGVVVFANDPFFGVVVKKWPRKSGEPCHPTTIAQVAIWDLVLNITKFTCAEDISIAYRDTAGTAFYARDVLVMNAYGTYCSWPGWGKNP
jgi:hypothetical protein